MTRKHLFWAKDSWDFSENAKINQDEQADHVPPKLV
jgi:hypothetical protein